LKSRKESWFVAPEDAGIRLDQFMVEKLAGESRSQIQIWIRKSHILVNGELVKTGYRTRTGDRIFLSIPAIPEDSPRPEKIPLEILYEDAHLAVVNKPAGLVCHLGAGIHSGTLVNALLYHMGPLNTGDPSRPGIVHRLDKNTSGVMVVAKNLEAHRTLSKAFKNRSIHKEYLALVYGAPSPEKGTIDLPLGRDPNNRKKISTRARRSRSAVTHYVVEKCYGSFSLLRIRLETGRTHQIRVHLAHMGHPIVGDSLYGGNRHLNIPDHIQSAVKFLHRPFLHSHRLQFQHPVTGKTLYMESALPEELNDFLVNICR
jgi:23S rRNA pseudouridine1911/1915/1917 synthase